MCNDPMGYFQQLLLAAAAAAAAWGPVLRRQQGHAGGMGKWVNGYIIVNSGTSHKKSMLIVVHKYQL
jgi:hypothetical protein